MWFWYAVGSALISAISITLNKKALKNVNASLVAWSLFTFSIPFLIYPALKDGWPTINITFIFAVIGSVITFTYAKTLALRSLKSSLMSDVVPLAFFAVLFQYVLGLIFLSESIKFLSIIGLIFIVFGGYILKVTEAKEDFLKPFKLLISNNESRAYLLAMIITAVASIFDKISIKNIQPINQSFVLLIENILTTILLTGYLIRKDKNWTSNLKNNFWSLSLNGMAYLILSLLFFYGITTGAVALVSGVKKLEVFFVLIFGWLIFRDKPKKEVWIGSFIMLLGVILIKLS